MALAYLLLFTLSRISGAPVSSADAASGTETSLTTRVQGGVLDGTGAAIQGAEITITGEDGSSPFPSRAVTDESGRFLIQGLAAGRYSLVVTASGFASQTKALITATGQTTDLGQITLLLARTSSTVQVTPSVSEIAAGQLTLEEQQRLFGLVPNFLVSYLHNAAPLNNTQKFQLAFKFVSDPASFGITGIIAGVEQANSSYPGYGQGSAGFGRRYGAAYGDFFIGNILASAVLPSLLKQDPRYFVKGEGSVKSRALYALANSFVRKGDNAQWQPDYSGILGILAAGALSNTYYPASDRNGVAATFKNAGIGFAAGAAANLLQEFLFRKLTPKVKTQNSPRVSP